MHRLLKRKHVYHVILGAESLDGTWSWTAATGAADTAGAPAEATTPWLLASVTKLYIATVTLRLYEQGLLDLDAPISAFLPSEVSRRLHIHKGIDYSERITATHLLGHLSGLPDSLDERPPGGRSLIERVIDEGDFSWSFEEAVDHARRELKTHFPPSDPQAARPRRRYSETNYQLLMVMAEHVAGRPMRHLYREFLFEKLGLLHTWLPGDRPLEPAGQPATTWIDDWALADRPLAMQSNGDLYGTTEDVLRFGRALFTGEVFENPDTQNIMGRHFTRFGFPRGMAALRAPSWPIEYGLGMMRFKLSRLLAGGLRLPALIGHTGSTGSWLWYCPQLHLLIAGTVDQSREAPTPFRLVPRALAGLPG